MSAPVVAVVVVGASIVSLVFGLAFCERLHVYIAASTDCDDGDADWGLGLRLRLWGWALRMEGIAIGQTDGRTEGQSIGAFACYF